jgi:hypothetical protein
MDNSYRNNNKRIIQRIVGPFESPEVEVGVERDKLKGVGHFFHYPLKKYYHTRSIKPFNAV